MAAPTFVAASSGGTDAAGAWSASCHAPGAAGRIIILQILQDGATSGAVALTGSANITQIATFEPDGWTFIGTYLVGASSEAQQHLWVGSSTGASAPQASGTNSTSEDLYWRFYEFNNVSATRTALSSIIEGGVASNGRGTSATADDTNVTVVGLDRLALNFIVVNDDNAIGSMSGESGGTWGLVPYYAESSGTDGSIALFHAAMASPGTISGGTASITDSDAWGVVGFALIGTTVWPTWDAVSWRFRRDDGNETTATWIAAERADITWPRNRNLRLRYEVQNTSANNDNASNWRLQYQVNSGSWTDLGTAVAPSASPYVGDNTDVTDQLTTGTGTFISGRFDEANGDSSGITVTANAHTEVEFCFKLNSTYLVPTDVVNFRVLENWYSTAYAVLDAYSGGSPTVTVGYDEVPRSRQYPQLLAH